MGLLSSAKESVRKAKSGIKNIGNRLSRVAKDQQQLQEELNHYEDLEGQVEQDIKQGRSEPADREARELEKADKEIAEHLKKLDKEVYQVLQEEKEDLRELANAFNQREKFEASTKETIRNIAEDHNNFDQHLKQAIQNLERYIEENKDGKGALYRGNVGRHAKSDEGKNWQDIARTANSLRKEMRNTVEREEKMLSVLQEEEKTLEEFKQEWEESISDVQKVKEDLQFYFSEEEEMERIAKHLQDNQLMEEIRNSRKGATQVKDLVSKLDEMVGQIDGILADLEREDDSILKHQTSVEDKAEKIKQMSANGLEEVEKIRRIIEGGKHPELSINSKEKWIEEINTIEKAMKEIQELVNKFEEIEEKEIKIEQEEESILETENQEGRTATGDH